MIVSLVDIEGNPEGILIVRLRRGYNLDVLIISSLRVVTIAGVLWENRFANILKTYPKLKVKDIKSNFSWAL